MINLRLLFKNEIYFALYNEKVGQLEVDMPDRYWASPTQLTLTEAKFAFLNEFRR